MQQSWALSRIKVAIRGGGDLGSGVAYRLHHAGFPVLITELEHPRLVRRAVAYGSAIVEKSVNVEGITAQLVNTLEDVYAQQAQNVIPVISEQAEALLTDYAPAVLIDARMLKTDPGQQPVEADLLIGLGPGFEVPLNCDIVIETNRSHNLGRVIKNGAPEPNTSVPGSTKGKTNDRVLRAPVAGTLENRAEIGSLLTTGDLIAEIDGHTITAAFDGALRGLMFDGSQVSVNEKIGDLDPRSDPVYCFTISDKSLAIGGGVLEAILASIVIRARAQQTIT